MKTKVQTFKELKKQYISLRQAKAKFDEGYFLNLHDTLAIVDSFLEVCNYKLEMDKRLRLTGKIKLFNYIEFAQRFQNAILTMIRPARVTTQAPPPISPTTSPQRDPNYTEQSNITRFLDVLGWSVKRVTFATRFHDITSARPATYSDPKVLQHIARLQS